MAAEPLQEILVKDRLQGLPQPFEHPYLMGQEKALETFLHAAQENRLHHAWLLSGLKGCGKATFAFHLARYFVELKEPVASIDRDKISAKNNPDLRIFKQIAGSAHPNLLHLRVPYDEQTKTFKTQLTVDEIRRTNRFFGSTAGDEGWRITIIDSLDELNTNAANALLKILEEPPAKTLFFLLTARPGRVLPTLLSRCQKLALEPLSVDHIIEILQRLAPALSVERAYLARHETLFGGSVRKVFSYLENGHRDILETLDRLLASSSPDVSALHKLIDVMSERGEEERYWFFIDYVEMLLSEEIRKGAHLPSLALVADVWEKMQSELRNSERYNLDRKLTVFSLFNIIKPALRSEL